MFRCTRECTTHSLAKEELKADHLWSPSTFAISGDSATFHDVSDRHQNCLVFNDQRTLVCSGCPLHLLKSVFYIWGLEHGREQIPIGCQHYTSVTSLLGISHWTWKLLSKAISNQPQIPSAFTWLRMFKNVRDAKWPVERTEWVAEVESHDCHCLTCRTWRLKVRVTFIIGGRVDVDWKNCV